MLKVLVPVDGSANSDRVIDHLIAARDRDVPMDIHLLNVQIPVTSGHVKMFVRQEDIDAYYREEGLDALKSAREKLERAGIPYHHHIAVGHVGETIANYAREHGFDRIVMGTHGRSAMTNLLLGSVATEVVHRAEVPVMLVK
ncbi:MAG TPA: universal stress protein [Candidatus Competibacteraceae bacterium]|nr:universal stress protein [Candidatus Competibacteraceae bacterium]